MICGASVVVGGDGGGEVDDWGLGGVGWRAVEGGGLLANLYIIF
jgi:hypothetical protein